MQSNETLWQIGKDNPEMCEKIRSALRHVHDPENGMDIIQLGMVRDIRIIDDKITVEMILTTPYCPYGPAILESARKTVEDTTGLKTTIEYGQEIWDQSMMEEGSGFDWGLY